MSPRTLILVAFGTGFAIAVAFATFGALWAKDLDFWAELGKAGVQFGVVVIGGAALATILKAVETERETKRQQREAFRLSLLRELTTAYEGLKEARRTLRGLPSTGPLTAEQVEKVRAQMKTLGEHQRSLEHLVHQIQVNPHGLANAERLVDPIIQLERYVFSLTDEWERHGATIAVGADASRVASLLVLRRFLEPVWGGGGFRAEAGVPVQQALHELNAM